MLVYLDESYASKSELLIGTLFIPSQSDRKWLHSGLTSIKINHGFITSAGNLKEIKYSQITTQKRLEIAQDAIDLFLASTDSYFRACVVPYSEQALDKVGRQQGVPRKIKEAMLYTHATINLIKNNIASVRDGILLMDEITRATGDRFDEMIRMKLATPPQAIFRHVNYVRSSSERNQTLQICDLLLGAVLNEYHPSSTHKNAFREYVKKKLNIPSLKDDYWKTLKKYQADKKHPKFHVRSWGVPYKFLPT